MKHYIKPETTVSDIVSPTLLAMSIGGTVSGSVGMPEFEMFDGELDEADSRFDWKW